MESGVDIGQINYNEIKNKIVEVDIIIYNKQNWSKGYGSSSLKLMSAYLEEKFHVESIYLDVHSSNERAIKAYEKAGFHKSEELVENNERVFRLKKANKYLLS
jgi:RimJ/RimL family protein N-acetyltransferase